MKFYWDDEIFNEQYRLFSIKNSPYTSTHDPMQRNTLPKFSLTRKNSPHKNSATSCRNKLLSDRASYESVRAESNLFVDIGL